MWVSDFQLESKRTHRFMVLRGYNRLLGGIELPIQASAQPPYHWEQQELVTRGRVNWPDMVVMNHGH
jgi:hypothetical protein